MNAPLLTDVEKIYYNSIRENLLHNFLEKYYKYTIVGRIDCLIDDIKMRCPFNVEFDSKNNNFVIWLDNSKKLTYTFVLERRQDSDLYVLKNII